MTKINFYKRTNKETFAFQTWILLKSWQSKVLDPVLFPANSLCPGTIYGFNVAANKAVQQMAAKKGIPLRLHRVIYKLIDELKEDLSSKLPPVTEENIIGEFNATTSENQD